MGPGQKGRVEYDPLQLDLELVLQQLKSLMKELDDLEENFDCRCFYSLRVG